MTATSDIAGPETPISPIVAETGDSRPPTRPRPPDRPPILSRRLSPIHTLAFVRKEIVAVLRQPRLLGVLVVGPFLLLFLFAVGYDQESSVLRTEFVGPEGSVFESATERFADDLEQYVSNAGYSSDLVAAEQRLANGEIDLVVVFPPDPADTVLGGEQAVITVLHDKLDPIQQTAVDVSAQVAVQELNSMVLEQVVGEFQTELAPYRETADESVVLLDELETAARRSDGEQSRRLAGELERNAAGLRRLVSATGSVRTTLGDELDPGDQEQLDQLLESIDRFESSTGRLARVGGDPDPDEIREARLALDSVLEQSDKVATLEPFVAVRPFTSDPESLVRDSVTINDFFAPAAIALLIQHMALTFAALGLVSDQSLGLFELFRVGSMRAGRVLLGKFLAHLVLGIGVAGALLAGVILLLDVPLRGDWWWVVAAVIGVLSASIAGGMVLSLLARTDSQAVQFAMLALLAGLFFGGFLLELEAIRFPVTIVSWLLPVTYGTTVLRDVMLRGAAPDPLDVAGLAATAVVYAALAWWLMSRRMRLG